MTTSTVGDAVAYHFRLSAEDAGALRNRADSSGLDPGEAIETASRDTLTGWVLAALAPNVSAARAANDFGALRDETVRFGTFISNAFSASRGPSAAKTFGLLAMSDLVALRDEDGAPAVVVRTAAHADGDGKAIDPYQLAFATMGASATDIRVTAVLPGQALAALALDAAGGSSDLISRCVKTAEEARIIRRAEGHRLSREAGISYA